MPGTGPGMTAWGSGRARENAHRPNTSHTSETGRYDSRITRKLKLPGSGLIEQPPVEVVRTKLGM